MIFLEPADTRTAQREAWARWAAIDPTAAALATAKGNLLHIPPNAATRIRARWAAAVAAGEENAVGAFYGPAYRFEDRRRLFRVTVGVDGALTGDSLLFRGGWRSVATVLATAGDRLALQHIVWTSGKAGAEAEIETLELNEVDASGRVVCTVLFDPDDRAGASTELFERYAASGADGAPALSLDIVRAWNDHDLERLRALLPADFYLDDRRRTGVGRIEGAAAYLRSLAALWDLSHDLRIDTLYFDRIGAHGRLYVAHWSGTNAEGGELDSVYVCLGLTPGDRPIGLEVFELDDFEAARARFEELHRSVERRLRARAPLR
jgi:hypothetical protein